jgi:hypothetical protein
MGSGLKKRLAKIIFGSVMLLFGIAVMLCQAIGFWSMRGDANSNPFKGLVWSMLWTTVAAFVAGAALIGGAWLISSATRITRHLQP